MAKFRHDHTNRVMAGMVQMEERLEKQIASSTLVAENERRALGAKVDTFDSFVQRAQADPQATAIARAALERLENVERAVDAHQQVLDRLTGAFSLVKLVLGTSVVGFVLSAIAVLKP